MKATEKGIFASTLILFYVYVYVSTNAPRDLYPLFKNQANHSVLTWLLFGCFIKGYYVQREYNKTKLEFTFISQQQ